MRPVKHKEHLATTHKLAWSRMYLLTSLPKKDQSPSSEHTREIQEKRLKRKAPYTSKLSLVTHNFVFYHTYKSPSLTRTTLSPLSLLFQSSLPDALRIKAIICKTVTSSLQPTGRSILLLNSFQNHLMVISATSGISFT